MRRQALDLKAVVGEKDAGRQRCFRRRVPHVVAHVREVGPLRLQRRAVSMETATVECVGCGLWRSASRNSTSRPRSRSSEDSGISL